MKKLNNDQQKIWLVWSIGHYANGHPLIDLRGVYSSKRQAKIGAKMVKDWAKNIEKIEHGISVCERVDIEERISNHTYGISMQTLKYL